MYRTNLARRGLLALGLTMALPAMALAQDAYPSRPVTVIVPYAAGGGADTLARIVFGKLSGDLGQQFLIENRPGGGGTVAARAVARAEPDGYTILHDATGFSINPSLFAKLPYDPAKDFQPVFLVGTLPLILLAGPSTAVKNVPDVIALAKSRPEGVDWASAGKGSLQHLGLQLFSAMADVPVTHIPYKGGGPALTDLLGGHVDFYLANMASAASYLEAGSLRGIAQTGAGQLAGFPDLPPVSDTLPGFEAYEWNGIFVPAGTPAAVVERLNQGLNAVIQDPDVMAKLATLSVQARPNTPAEFGTFVSAETARWAKVIHDAGISPE